MQILINKFEANSREIVIKLTRVWDCYFAKSLSLEKRCMNDISFQDVLSNIVV